MSCLQREFLQHLLHFYVFTRPIIVYKCYSDRRGSAGLAAVQTGSVLAQGHTDLHEEGRCAIRGNCGKKSFFGGELPCPDNGLAREPEEKVRDKLVSLCGDKWKHGPVCCEDEQVISVLPP